MAKLNLSDQIKQRTGTSDSQAVSLTIKDIPIGDISIKNNVRQDYTDINELAESIYQHGLLQPITVYPDGESYIIKTGHRRFKAYQNLYKEFPEKFSTIRCIISDEKNIAIIQLVENVQREGLSDKDLSQGLISLKQEKLSNEQIAKIIGKSTHYVDNIFSAINDTEKMPELKEFLQTPVGGSLQVIAETSGIQDVDERKKLIQQKLDGEITRKELREKKKVLQKEEEPRTPAGGSSLPEVTLSSNEDDGKIEIIFQTKDTVIFQQLYSKLQSFLKKVKIVEYKVKEELDAD